MPIITSGTDHHFDEVMVWDNLGGAVRVRRNGLAQVVDPSAGTPVTVQQDGQDTTVVRSDSNGRVAFVAQQGIIKLLADGLSTTLISAEQATAGADNAAQAQAAQVAAESARDDAQLAAGSVFAVSVVAYGAKGDGVTDDTAAVQSALDRGGAVMFPAGTYLCGALVAKSGTRIYGNGAVTILHKSSGGYAGNFPRACLTSPNQPTYIVGGAAGRSYAAGVASDITVEGITFDGGGAHVYGVQMVATDRVHVRNVTIKNCSGGLDLRAVRDSSFADVLVSNISEDGISVTDQNFAAGVKASGLRGISENLVFERCTVVDSQTSNGLGTTSMNAFEMDDGMSSVVFRDCRAINSRGSGFEFHLHTNEYDLADVQLINCYALNCTPNGGDTRQVAGFMLGQCPSGSYLGRVTYEGCTSLGSPNAYAHIPGAESGSIDDIKIIGGTWKSLQAETDRNFARSTAIYAGKLFTNMHITGATIGGAADGYGVYTYATAGDLHMTDVTISDCYSPLYLSHTGGGALLRGVTAAPGAPVGDPTTTCCYLLCDSVTLNDFRMVVDQTRYTSSVVRLVGVDFARMTGLAVRNTGTVGSNGIYVQDCGQLALSGSAVGGFANGVFFSGSLGSMASSGNTFKTCTAKYNTTPAGLVDAGNAI